MPSTYFAIIQEHYNYELDNQLISKPFIYHKQFINLNYYNNQNKIQIDAIQMTL